MTQDNIIALAQEAGFEIVDGKLRLYFDGDKILLKPNHEGTVVDGLKEFATLLIANERELSEQAEKQAYLAGVNSGIEAEREACAKICDAVGFEVTYRCADVIRARTKNQASIQ